MFYVTTTCQSAHLMSGLFNGRNQHFDIILYPLHTITISLQSFHFYREIQRSTRSI